ncbi:MAG: tRNA uridine-5-carboxymethylaminomethyl(34) synthesis GTPase MnmE [Candidatus Omnitrophota bacterium]
MSSIHLNDTIVAVSTPPGQGGIGIVRLSGPDAIAIAGKMFLSRRKKKVSSFKNYTAYYGWIVKKRTETKAQKPENEMIDEALLTVMRAPHSYTKEDIVEISAHGGMVPLRAILHQALQKGARLAEPGEFTKRAFLNGRLDLTQAEAVLDIIQAKTDAFLKISLNQLKGDLTHALESIREELMDIYTDIEATMNFPDEEIDVSGRRSWMKKSALAMKRIEKLLESSHHGRILREGIKVVIAGKPNVGKSSLLNVLLKSPRAIVTEIAGTTRDTIEETAQIKGIPLQLVDTAGILRPRNLIEKEAVRRSHLSIEEADLILFVLDASQPLTGEDAMLIEHVQGKNVIVLFNKSDLKKKINEEKVRKKFNKCIRLKISALKKMGIDKLEEKIVENVWHGKVVSTQGILVSNARHIQALEQSRGVLREAQENLSGNLPCELVSEDMKAAINHLDAITGRNVTSDCLDHIFSNFCIGK